VSKAGQASVARQKHQAHACNSKYENARDFTQQLGIADRNEIERRSQNKQKQQQIPNRLSPVLEQTNIRIIRGFENKAHL